jgi:hypothetical protein
MAGDLCRDLLGASLTALPAFDREAACCSSTEISSDVLYELNPRNGILHHIAQLARS